MDLGLTYCKINKMNSLKELEIIQNFEELKRDFIHQEE